MTTLQLYYSIIQFVIIYLNVGRLKSHKISAFQLVMENVNVKPENRTFDCLRLTAIVQFFAAAAHELPLALPQSSAMCYYGCYSLLYLSRISLL